MTAGCIPVKSPARAKHRLRHVLSAEQREDLARAMFEDVLIEARKVRGLDRLVVLTNDAQAMIIAAAAGASVMVEGEQHGHSRSADWAAQELMKRGAHRLLLIPIDVPLVRAQEIESLLDAARGLAEPSLVIVPSEDGTGTNAMVRTPPDLIVSRFGPNSLPVHVRQAEEKGATVRVMRPPGLVFDLDEPADLSLFLEKNPTGRTAQRLREFRENASHAGS